jgi:hypothetical protein
VEQSITFSSEWEERGSSVTGAHSNIKWHCDRNAVTAHLLPSPVNSSL